MRSHFRLLPILMLTASCTNGHDEEMATVTAAQDRFGRLYGGSATRDLAIAEADLIQQTCALYVAVRSHAWKDQLGFGRDLDVSMVHWNTCPGGTMVACVVAPTANGDSVVTGIPLH